MFFLMKVSLIYQDVTLSYNIKVVVVKRVVDKTSSQIPRLEEMLSLCVPTNHRKAISSCNLAAIFVETCVQVLHCGAFCDDFYGEDAALCHLLLDSGHTESLNSFYLSSVAILSEHLSVFGQCYN